MAACRTVRENRNHIRINLIRHARLILHFLLVRGRKRRRRVVQHRTGTPSMAALALLVDFLGQSCEAKKAVEDLGRDAFNDVKGSRPNKALKSQR